MTRTGIRTYLLETKDSDGKPLEDWKLRFNDHELIWVGSLGSTLVEMRVTRELDPDPTHFASNCDAITT